MASSAAANTRKRGRPYEIFVETPSGDKLTLEVNSDELVSSVLAKLQDLTGIPVGRMLLFHPTEKIRFGGNPLKHNNHLGPRAIKDGTVLTLVYTVTITIRLSSGVERQLLNRRCADTVESLKYAIQDLEGIPVERQRLNFNGFWLDDSTTLATSRVTDGAELQLMCKLRIYVRSATGIHIRLEEMWNNTKIGAIRSILRTRQELTFRGNALFDYNTLWHYGIQHNDVLDL